MAEQFDYVIPSGRVRRRRDSTGTRESILMAARELLAHHGEQALSVTQIARHAGISRSTAYLHFETREQLIEAATDGGRVSWASDELCRVVFGDLDQDQPLTASGIEGVTERLVLFVMEHPELGRVWLFQLLGAPHPTGDKFWRLYISKLEKFAKSELAQPGLDVEAHAVLMLAATVLWTLRAHAQTHSVEERRQMAQRFAHEILRLSLGGSRQLEKLCYSLLRGAKRPPAAYLRAPPNRSAGSN